MFQLCSQQASKTAKRTESSFLCCVLDTGAWKKLKTRFWHFVAKKPIVIGIISVCFTIAVAGAMIAVTIHYKNNPRT